MHVQEEAAATRRSPRIDSLEFRRRMQHPQMMLAPNQNPGTQFDRRVPLPQMLAALEQNANNLNNSSSNNENLNEAQRMSKALIKKQRSDQKLMNQLGNLSGLLNGLKVQKVEKSAGVGKHSSRTAQLQLQPQKSKKPKNPKKTKKSKASAAAKPVVRTKQQTLTAIKGILQKTNEDELTSLSQKQINMINMYIQKYPSSLSNFTSIELDKIYYLIVTN